MKRPLKKSEHLPVGNSDPSLKDANGEETLRKRIRQNHIVIQVRKESDLSTVV